MKKLLALFLLLPLSFICDASTLQSDEPARPWAFWYWMYGAVSAEGIRADLKAMKDAGLEGCYLMPIRGNQERPEHGGEAQQLSETFWKMVDLALQQADSLGLKMGIHICDGFALAGGPWITPEESMQKVIWADTLVVVGKRGQAAVALPPVKGYDGFFRDIATFAVSAEEPLPEPIITGTIAQDEGGTFRSREPGYIEFSYDEAQTVRCLEVIPSGNNLQAQRLLVQASDDGILFRNVRQLIPPRQGWQNTDCNYTFSLPETTATHFRFTWTPEGTEPGSEDLDAGKWAPTLKIKELRLSADPRIDLYEGKSGAVWRIAPRDTSAAVSANRRLPQVIPLTEGTRLPPGRWRILRFAHTSTAHSNATGGGAKGLECDKFSAQAVGKQLDNWYALFKQRPNSHVITCMHVDSWECGSQNWSATFPDEFQKRRGYDLLPFMPVFAGIPMENDEQVLADIRQTIGDLLTTSSSPPSAPVPDVTACSSRPKAWPPRWCPTAWPTTDMPTCRWANFGSIPPPTTSPTTCSTPSAAPMSMAKTSSRRRLSPKCAACGTKRRPCSSRSSTASLPWASTACSSTFSHIIRGPAAVPA